MARARSKNYPSLSLGQAIERARALYKQEGRAAAPADVVVSAWGYNSLNGASLRVLSALRQYGLLEGSSDQTRLAPRALTLLLEPESHPEFAEALTEALQAPALFQGIVQEYGVDLPSDPALISYLVRKQNFGDAAAKTLIGAFRESVELVKAKGAGYIAPVLSHNALQTYPDNVSPKPMTSIELASQISKATREFTFPVTDDTVITLSIRGPLPSGDDIDAVTDWLEVVQRQIVRKARSSPVVEPIVGDYEIESL